jgi:hypothetical protein
MSVFMYGDGKTLNIIAPLSELETAILLLGNPGAFLNKEMRRWEEYGGTVAEVMRTGGTLHLTVAAGDAGAPQAPWRGPLANAAPPLRTRASAALDFFAGRYGVSCDPHKVDVIVG